MTSKQAECATLKKQLDLLYQTSQLSSREVNSTASDAAEERIQTLMEENENTTSQLEQQTSRLERIIAEKNRYVTTKCVSL